METWERRRRFFILLKDKNQKGQGQRENRTSFSTLPSHRYGKTQRWTHKMSYYGKKWHRRRLFTIWASAVRCSLCFHPIFRSLLYCGHAGTNNSESNESRAAKLLRLLELASFPKWLSQRRPFIGLQLWIRLRACVRTCKSVTANL